MDKRKHLLPINIVAKKKSMTENKLFLNLTSNSLALS